MKEFEPLIDGVVGGWYGDESKALTVTRKLKLTNYTAVARYNGGNNAGGKVVMPDGTVFKFNSLPAGLAHNILGILGKGVLLNPAALHDEITEKNAQGLKINDTNLAVSDRATLILPGNIREDEDREKGIDKQGTTKKGIAPAAAAKYGRRAPTAELLLKKPVELGRIALENMMAFSRTDGNYFESRKQAQDEVYEWLEKAMEVRRFVVNTDVLVQEILQSGHSILAEGAQSLGLSIESRDYPHVTSSHAGPAGIQLGLGVSFRQLREIVAVVKATPSRVGDGPFPTEIHDPAIASRVRGNKEDIDGEYGTVTGRERRIGWPDFKKQRDLLIEHGISKIALSKLDCVPRYGETIKVATQYDSNGEPVYDHYPTWSNDICNCRRYSELPQAAKAHVDRYSAYLGVDIESVGVGPNEDQVIYL